MYVYYPFGNNSTIGPGQNVERTNKLFQPGVCCWSWKPFSVYTLANPLFKLLNNTFWFSGCAGLAWINFVNRSTMPQTSACSIALHFWSSFINPFVLFLWIGRRPMGILSVAIYDIQTSAYETSGCHKLWHPDDLTLHLSTLAPEGLLRIGLACSFLDVELWWSLCQYQRVCWRWGHWTGSHNFWWGYKFRWFGSNGLWWYCH